MQARAAALSDFSKLIRLIVKRSLSLQRPFLSHIYLRHQSNLTYTLISLSRLFEEQPLGASDPCLLHLGTARSAGAQGWYARRASAGRVMSMVQARVSIHGPSSHSLVISSCVAS